MKTVHIFDIDSTIADNTQRALLLQKFCVICLTSKPAGFGQECPSCGRSTHSHIDKAALERFFAPEAVLRDVPIHKAQQFVTKLRQRGSDIHFLTGRDESLRDVTAVWLSAHFGRVDTEKLIMRPLVEAHMVASEYKELAFLRFVKEQKYALTDLFLFYEDDPHVLSMYGRHGIVVKCPEAWGCIMPEAPMFEEVPFTVA